MENENHHNATCHKCHMQHFCRIIVLPFLFYHYLCTVHSR